jgi:hypothetical protein
MEEINIKISSKEVKVESKPLRARWSLEMVKDLQYHSTIDLENIYKRIERKRKIRNIFL